MARNILIMLFFLYLAWGGASSRSFAGAADSDSSTSPDQLRYLLSEIKSEPLAVLLIKDVKRLSKDILRTSFGQLWLDKRYNESRLAVLKEWSQMMGFDAQTFWGRLDGNLEGPLLIVLQENENSQDGKASFGATVMLTAVDVESAKAIWSEVKKHTGWLDWVRVHIVRPGEKPKDMTAVTLPPWAQAFSEGGGLLRFRVQASSLRHLMDEEALGRFPFLKRAMETVRNLIDGSVKQFTWSMDLDGKDFIDHLDMELVKNPKGTFPKLLSIFGKGVPSWEALARVLPGRQDGAVFLNLNASVAGDELRDSLQMLERVLRGKKWTRRHGSSEEALESDRFNFISDALSGRVGISARLALSGQVDLVTVGATRTNKIKDVRDPLFQGLKGLGAPFKQLEKAAKIGTQRPWAANFKGRSFLPAPVIGLSKGWVWLCSAPSAYQSLTRSLAKRRMLVDDAYWKAMVKKVSPSGIEPLPESSFSLRLNLIRVFPLLYTAWLLSEDGPKLGSRSVSLRFLPQPNLFSKRFGTFQADMIQKGSHIRAYGRGPVPGGAILPVGLLVRVSQLLDRLKQGRTVELKRTLDALNQPSPAATSEGQP